MESFLPNEFIQKSKTYLNSKDRLRFLIGKKMVADAYLKLNSKPIDWTKYQTDNSSSKPIYIDSNKIDLDITNLADNTYVERIKKSATTPFHFSISHSENMVGCAFTQNSPIGLDLQKKLQMEKEAMEMICNQEEIEMINAHPHPIDQFYLLWTIKEAILKLTGEGLFGDLQNFTYHTLDSDRMEIIYQEKKYHVQKINLPNCTDYISHLASASIAPIEISEWSINDLYNQK